MATSGMSNLCEICRNLDFAAISFRQSMQTSMFELYAGNHDQYEVDFRDYDDRKDNISTPDDDNKVRRLLTPYHNTLQSLVESAKARNTPCHFCKLVLNSVNRVLDARSARSGERGGRFFITGRSAKGSGVMVVGGDENANRKRPEYMLMAVFEFRVNYGSILSDSIRNFNLIPSASDATVMRLLKSWLLDCKRCHRHSFGQSHREVLLPTRVLSISEDAQRVFVDPNYAEDNGEYVALSHCWGLSPTVRLLASNSDQLSTAGLPVEALPRTFQDAVHTTYALGYRQLWIDSLCIQQDVSEDWRKESAKMHDIYRKAVVTIAASRASDSAAGFLGPRIMPDHAVVPYTVIEGRHARDRGDVLGDISSYVRGAHGVVFACAIPLRIEHWEYNANMLQDEPLSTRAWTLQERLLSTRTVHFTSEGIYLECDDHFLPENFLYPAVQFVEGHERPAHRHAGEIAAPHRSSFDAFLGGALWSSRHLMPASYKPVRIIFAGGQDDDLADTFTTGWNDLVREFSRRAITFPKDKLPALAGLAAEFSKAQTTLEQEGENASHGGDIQAHGRTKLWSYYAGLFLPSDGGVKSLLWEIDGRAYLRLAVMRANGCQEPFPSRPDEYRAPSWSWASLNGAAIYEPHVHVDFATIQHVHIELQSASNPFGQITSAASMSLKATLCDLYRGTPASGEATWYMDAPGTTDATMVVLPRWDIGGNYTNLCNMREQDLDSVDDRETGLKIAILGSWTGEGRGRADRHYGLRGLIIKHCFDSCDYQQGFERQGGAFIRAGKFPYTGTTEYHDVWRKRFETGEGMTEILLY